LEPGPPSLLKVTRWQDACRSPTLANEHSRWACWRRGSESRLILRQGQSVSPFAITCSTVQTKWIPTRSKIANPITRVWQGSQQKNITLKEYSPAECILISSCQEFRISKRFRVAKGTYRADCRELSVPVSRQMAHNENAATQSRG